MTRDSRSVAGPPPYANALPKGIWGRNNNVALSARPGLERWECWSGLEWVEFPYPASLPFSEFERNMGIRGIDVVEFKSTPLSDSAAFPSMWFCLALWATLGLVLGAWGIVWGVLQIFS